MPPSPRPAAPIAAALVPATLAAALALAGTARADEIRVLNWKGYGTDEPWALEAFEAATGHTVVHDYFNSEQELLTKLRTSPGAYDVAMINVAFTGQAIDEELVQPVDVSMLEHHGALDEAMAGSPLLNRDGETWGVPWVWGLTGLAIDESAFEAPPESLGVMWEADRRGRVTLRDDALEAVQFGALATGQDINAIEDLGAVRERLAELVPQLRAYWSSENDWNQMVAAGQIDVGTYWSGSAARAKTAFDLPVRFVVPEEGAVGWLDSLTVAAGSERVEAAHAFIDWMIDPEFYVRWDTDTGAPVSANLEAVAALPEDAFNRAVMGDPETLGRVQFQAPVSDADRERYVELWQGLKADVD